MALLQNKKAFFDYEILQKFEAGIELLGFEVKSLKKGEGSLAGAFVIVRGNEVFVTNMNIPPYQVKNTPADYDPMRPRKLLLTKKEIEEIGEIEQQKGLTIIPLSVYNKGGKLKMEIGAARGKKKFDKRESIKKRDTDREIRKQLKA